MMDVKIPRFQIRQLSLARNGRAILHNVSLSIAPGEEVNGRSPQIEVALALGATGRQAAHPYLSTALHNGMTPIVDSAKTVGLIQLPGAMTGMILAGASPLEAVQLQITVMYMLIGAAAFTGLTIVWLTYRQFFTANHQLKLSPAGGK